MTITIIYHAYKNHLTLEESIKTFAKQNDTDFEFILVNDGANNKTTKVLSKIDFSKFKHFQYYDFSQNVGHSFSFNTAFKNLESDYVYYAGSNTMVKPEFIGQVKRLLIKAKPDVLSMMNYKADGRLQIFNRPDVHFKKHITQSTRIKIFSVPLLRANGITMDETYYAPLVFIYKIFTHFRK
ncbi:hypothetical protein FACS1894166_01950 [Bacilli bacterium]|nr:hypothetical protein FACS1894166_01950 [Bacilli bacterium]